MTTMPAEVALTELSGDLLRARVARAQVYLIHLHQPSSSSGEPAQVLLRDHLAYLYKLEQEGRLYGYGPVERLDGDPARELAIVVAASAEEAQRIAGNEPLHRSGYRSNTVQGHTMNEGIACYVARALSKRAIARGESFDPDFSDVTLSYDELLSRASNAPLYLVPLVPTDKPRSPADTATFDGHFVWLRENEMAARLMTCGPVQPPQPLAPGIWGGGLGIVATSRAEAERIAETEPSGRAGYRVLSVRGWIMQNGLAAPIAEALVALNALPG
jgi:uncharacterized protein YciI